MRLAAYQFAVCGDIDHNLEIIKKLYGRLMKIGQEEHF